MKNRHPKFKAQTMLLAVMIVAATAIATGVSVAIVASSGAGNSVVQRDALLAQTLAHSCLEDNLLKIARQDFNPTSFTTAEGSCTIEISGGTPYILNVEAIVGKSRNNLRVTLSVTNEIVNIEEWGENY